jgi:hypothetical protein
MPNINIDIDLDDFYGELSYSEKKLLGEWLEEDGYYEKIESMFPIVENHFDREWEEIIKKLEFNRIQLTIEEEEIIKTIYKKLV